MWADGPEHAGGEPKSTAPTRPECSTRASVCHVIVAFETMGTAAYMLYHLMLLPVKLINLFDQSRIMDMEMVPLAPGLCSDPLLYRLLLSRLCGGHLLSQVAAGIQDT